MSSEIPTRSVRARERRNETRGGETAPAGEILSVSACRKLYSCTGMFGLTLDETGDRQHPERRGRESGISGGPGFIETSHVVE